MKETLFIIMGSLPSEINMHKIIKLLKMHVINIVDALDKSQANAQMRIQMCPVETDITHQFTL